LQVDLKKLVGDTSPSLDEVREAKCWAGTYREALRRDACGRHGRQ